MGAQLSGCADGVFAHVSRPKGRVTLKYLAISGRAEPIRLALVLGGFDFEDQRITANDWVEKHKKLMPYGQVPVLVVEGRLIAQAKAILRYVGKMTQWSGKPIYPRDPLVAAQVDQLVDAFDEIWLVLAPTYRIKDQEQKEQVRQKLFAKGGEGAKFVDIFERTISESKNGYAVDEAGFSVADLMWFCSLNVIRSGFVEGLGPETFKDYPNIMKHKEMIANISEINGYYTNKGKSNPLNNPFYDVFLPGK